MHDAPQFESTTEPDKNSVLAEEPTSVVLQALLDNLPSDEVKVEYLVQQLSHRSFGGLIILLGIMALVPGISVLAGLALLLPGIQMMLGYRVPLLPPFLSQRTINRGRLQSFGGRAMPWLQQLESRIRPRWCLLIDLMMPHVIGALVVSMGLVIILPFPLVNFLPGIALVVLSLGLLQRDGVMVLVGCVCAVLAILLGSIMVKAALNALFLVL